MANQRKNNNKMNMNMSRPSMLWLYGLIGAFIIGYYVFGDVNDTPVPSDWATVERMVEKGEVEKIQVVNRDQAQVFLKKEAVEQYRRDTVDKRFRRLPETGVQLLFTIGSVDSFREDLKAAEQQSGQVVPVVYENKANDWTNVLINLLPWVLIIGVWIFVMRSMSRGAGGGAGGGIMNVGKAKAQVFDKDNSKRVTFKDVAGLEEAKVEIMEIVDFLKKSDKYKELGAKIPKGALLVGPPGTGKTLLANYWGAMADNGQMSWERFREIDYFIRFDLQSIGTIAFPLFCFLLAEGFQHTRSKKRYIGLMLAFALISEVPFDIGFFSAYSRMEDTFPFYLKYQNVFFTLFLGLLTLVCLERFSCKSDLPVDRIKSAVLQVLSVVLFSGIAEGIHCDYGMQGILFISAFYICRNHRIYQVLLFLLAYMGTTGNQPPLCTLLACLLILLYNGKRGKLKLKYFFYVFYPAHILVLYLIQIGLGKYLLK